MSAGKNTILVVDDDRDFRRAVCAVLAAGGYRAVEETNAMTILTSIRKIDPDLVLMDLNMPGCKVTDLVHTMKQLEVSTKIMILSGNVGTEEYQTLRQMGVQDFLAKPVTGEELIGRIKQVLLRTGGKETDSDI